LKQNQTPSEETQHELYNYNVSKCIVQLQGEAARQKVREWEKTICVCSWAYAATRWYW